MRLKNLLHLGTISLFVFTLITCDYTDYPDAIWDADDTGDPTPVITSVDPQNLAYEGITEITITGQNFSSVASQNQITFNGVIAVIDEDKSTATTLVATVPVIIEDSEINALDSVQVLIAAQGAYVGALYEQNFRVERAVIEWGGFVGEKPEKNPNAIAVDSNENIFIAAADKILYKVDTLGVRTEFGTGFSATTNDLKVGPGGYVYFCRNNPYVYRVDPAGGAADRWHSVAKKIACFDFDENQNIYCGGKNDSLYVFNITDEVNRGVAPSLDYSYAIMRVYDGYLYVAGEYVGLDTNVTVLQGIWRHEIVSGQDTLGSRELVYDWSNYTYSDEQDILSMTINSDGLFYIGVSEGNGPAIITLDPSTGDTQAFYDAVLSTPTTSLSWGNGNYIYLARYSISATEAVPNGAYRISQTLSGAPYKGRN